MNPNFIDSEFYNELESSLYSSTFDIRKNWVRKIIEENIPINEYSGILKSDRKTANRFLWLLSEIGLVNPDKLLTELPFLLDAFEHYNPIYKTSLASYWLIAGVPQENEGKAIDILFQFLMSGNTNVTIKARSMLVLFKLTKKYPELKNELTLCLKDQMDKYSIDFKKRVSKILIQLEQVYNHC